MFNSLMPNLFPGKKIATATLAKTQEERDASNAKIDADIMSRRGFLKFAGAAAVVGLGGLDIFGINEAKAEGEAVKSNNSYIDKLNTFLKKEGYVLDNPATNYFDIYDDCKDIISDYNNGKFHKDKNKFYKPRSLHFMEAERKKNNRTYPPIGFEIIKLEADVIIIGEVEGAKTNGPHDVENIMKKGFVVLEKGTEIIRKKVDGNYENYIKDCFNRIYAGHKLCPTPACKK